MNIKKLDYDARYTVESMPGVAWWLVGPEVESYWEDDDILEERETGMVIAVMVGDDRKHVIDPDELVPLDEDGYCPGCGQTGCHHYN